jgi:WD40 repeat protein
MMKRWGVVAGMIVTLSLPWSVRSVEAKMDNLPRTPGATLLVGYAPGNLMVTIGDATLGLQTEGGNSYVLPSLSADGNLVASARYADLASTVPRAFPLLTVGVYSMIEKRWRDYPRLEVQGGSVAISPDGSKLAYVMHSTAEAPRIQFLDLKTGAVSTGPESMKNNGHITWSPDGRRIAFDRETEIERTADGKPISPPMAIFVFDVETGTVSKIADGMSPSWSPSGEWIAFYDYWPDRDDVKKDWHPANDNHVSVIHPDGTGHKVLVSFNANESLTVPAVWSPNSKSLLVNKSHDTDKGTMDIYLLDIATSKLRKEFGNVPPVYGWVAAK